MSISSLEAELNRQRAINRELRQELNEIASGVLSGYQALEQCNRTICDTLNNSHQKLEGSHSRELSSIEMQAEIDKMYVNFKQMELANKKIRECNNKKYYDFANYRTVRKLVQGMMDNLDVHMVSDAVIYKSVEAQQLKTPDYWLTCVLIAVMAWKNDDRPLAERAIQIALEMDKKNSAVFFMLFNLRMQRDDAVGADHTPEAGMDEFLRCVVHWEPPLDYFYLPREDKLVLPAKLALARLAAPILEIGVSADSTTGA